MDKDHRERKEDLLFNDTVNTFYLWLYGIKEDNVFFNDTVNTFYLWLYGIIHMVKDDVLFVVVWHWTYVKDHR